MCLKELLIYMLRKGKPKPSENVAVLKKQNWKHIQKKVKELLSTVSV